MSISEESNFKDFFQSKEKRKQIREYLNEIYSVFKPQNIHFVEKFIYTINSSLEVDKEIFFEPEAVFSVKNHILINDIKSKIENGIHSNNELLSQFKPDCAIQVGHKLDSIPEVQKFIVDNSQPKNFIIEEGKSTVIYLWSIHSLLSKKHLKHLNEMYNKNKRSWDAHLRIVYVNIDKKSDIEESIELVKYLKMFEATHFNLPFDENNSQNLYIKLALDKGYPLCIVVNSDNIVQMIGSLMDANLDRIVKESVQRNLITSQSVFNRGGIKEEEKAVLKNVIKELYSKLDNIKKNDLINAPHLVKAELVVKRVYTVGKINLVNPRYNIQNQHQSIHTPSSENTLKMAKKHHTIKQKIAAKEALIGNHSNTGSHIDNIGTNPLKTNTKFFNNNSNSLGIHHLNSNLTTENNKTDTNINSNSNQNTGLNFYKEPKVEKPFFTPKMYFVELYYTCHSSDEELLSDLFKNLNYISNISVAKSHVKTEELNFGSNCENCKSPLILKLPSKAASEIGDDDNYTFSPNSHVNSDKKANREINLENINYLDNKVYHSNNNTIKEIVSPNLHSQNLNTKNLSLLNNELQNLNVHFRLNSQNYNFEEGNNYNFEQNDSNDFYQFNSLDFNHLHQYICSFCNYHLCYECGNKVSNIDNPNNCHNHHLLLLRNTNRHFIKYVLKHNCENQYTMDFKYFQVNHFPNDLKMFKIHYQAKCDGCLVFPITTTRWKCCNCVYKNLCDKCFSAVTFFSDKSDNNYNSSYRQTLGKNSSSEHDYSEEIKYNLKRVGCDAVLHVFMKIIFDGYFY